MAKLTQETAAELLKIRFWTELPCQNPFAAP